MPGKIYYNEIYSYAIFDDGYDIYNVNNVDPDHAWISQRGDFSRLFVPNGTYEENAVAQIESIIRQNAEFIEERGVIDEG